MQRTRRRLQLSEISPHLKCVLCGGYFIDATTIVECLHSFCRSCLIKYLRTNSFCPICDVQIHKTKPFLNIKPDKTLQDIVYKLVPGLFHTEMRRRRIFYSKHPEQLALTRPEERGMGVERIIYSADDSFSLSLEYYDEERAREEWKSDSSRCSESGTNDSGSAVEPSNAAKRYLKCPALVTVAILKKFITLKYDLRPYHKVDVIYRRESLADEYTLMDVAYIYTWKRSGPMRFFYHITDTKVESAAAARESVTTQAVLEKSRPDTVTSSSVQEAAKESPQERQCDQSTTAQVDTKEADVATTSGPATSTSKGAEESVAKANENCPPSNKKSTEAAPKVGTSKVAHATTEKLSNARALSKPSAASVSSRVGTSTQAAKNTDNKAETLSKSVVNEAKTLKTGGQVSMDADSSRGGSGKAVDAGKSGSVSSSTEIKTPSLSVNANVAQLADNSAKVNVAIAVLSNGFVAPKTDSKIEVNSITSSQPPSKTTKTETEGQKSDAKTTVNSVKSVPGSSSNKDVPAAKVGSEASGSIKVNSNSNVKRQELKTQLVKESADSGRSKLVPNKEKDVQSVKPPLENPNQQILTKNDEIIATPSTLKRQQCYNDSLKRKLQNNEVGRSYLSMQRLQNEANKAFMKRVRLLKQESNLSNALLKRSHEGSHLEAELSAKKSKVEKETSASAVHKGRITPSSGKGRQQEVAVNGDRAGVSPDSSRKEPSVEKGTGQNNKVIDKMKKSARHDSDSGKDGPTGSSVKDDMKPLPNSKGATEHVTSSDAAVKKAEVRRGMSDVTRGCVDAKCARVDFNQKHVGNKTKPEPSDKTSANSRPSSTTHTPPSGGKKSDSDRGSTPLPHLIEIPKVSEKKPKGNVKSVGQSAHQNMKHEINKESRPSPKHDRIGALDLTSSRSQPLPPKRQAPAPPLSPLSPFPLMSLPLRSPPPQLKIPSVSRPPQQRASSLSSSSPSPPADSRSPRVGTSPPGERRLGPPDYRGRMSVAATSRTSKASSTSPGSEAKSRLVHDDLMGPPTDLKSIRQQLEMRASANVWGALAMNPNYFRNQQQQLKEAYALMTSLGIGSVPQNSMLPLNNNNSTCNRKA